MDGRPIPVTVGLTVAARETYSRTYPLEWRRICARRHNVLFEGSAFLNTAALASLAPHLGANVSWQRPGRRLELAACRAQTLVLPDIALLNAEDQACLMDWMNEDRRRQVVSTTTKPLFRLVGEGLFDETLYYRLNVVLLRSGSRWGI